MAMTWIFEIETAKSLAAVSVSHIIHRGDELRVWYIVFGDCSRIIQIVKGNFKKNASD